MKFLEEIAEWVIRRYTGKTDRLTIIFPNRRAGLFFKKYLAEKISAPIWLPEVKTIEEFIIGLSPMQTADKLELIFELYRVFMRINKTTESFDRFYYWGNVLLQDFDESDKFLVDPDLMFKNLLHVKQAENSLDYLDEDQKKIIKEFWLSFGDKLSEHKKNFLGIWDNLPAVYEEFRKELSKKGTAYNGMIYRSVAESSDPGSAVQPSERFIFAGFNALSASEEKIISYFVNEGKAEIFWDADDFYLKDPKQEAGKYLREMKFGNPALRKSFKESYGNAYLGKDKNIRVIRVASNVGQVQQASELLAKYNIPTDERTALVLPNNELLFPLLHALPEEVEKLNITMGYPLASSPVFGFLDALIDLQNAAEGKTVYHFRSVLTVLRHPLQGSERDEGVEKLISDILKYNTVWISEEVFNKEHEVLNLIFSKPQSGPSGYLLRIIEYFTKREADELNREFFFRFYTVLNRLNEFIDRNGLDLSYTSFQKIFRQMVQNEHLPFEGEPLLGLQVMGVLETRNLDFDTVIMLSMNENMIPPPVKNASFIPYSIRKVFGLPVPDSQDSMYAYIFYRLVQRAKNIYFISNASEENGQSGEVSRFVRQLEYETAFTITSETRTFDVTVEDPHVIAVRKNEQIIQKLMQYTSGNKISKRLTATALNNYLDCRLKFYFKYVLELNEPEEVSEEVDARVFGNILHKVMEHVYLPYDRDERRTVTKEEMLKIKKRTEEEINRTFADQFGIPGKKFEFEGENILAKEIIKKMVLKVLEYDTAEVPFDILGVEANEKKGFVSDLPITIHGTSVSVGIKGVIDRIEKKEEVIRIIDYKTGRDKISFTDIPSLFDRENKSRNKAVFQTFLYGLLYHASPGARKDLPVKAGLYAVRELFNENFSPWIRQKEGRTFREVYDINAYAEAFRNELIVLLTEIYNPELAFDQTDDLRKCDYCPYSGICNR